jgi:hypothetical protein
MTEPVTAPAFYARRGGRAADWWTLLHPPYTAWHLSYVALGAVLVVGYNLELFDGRLHTDAAFAWAWGGFPAAVGYLAQSPTQPPGPDLTSVVAALVTVLAAVCTASAQRVLSTSARGLRRRTAEVSGTVRHRDGRVEPITRQTLLAAPERALRALSWALPLLAAAMLLARA